MTVPDSLPPTMQELARSVGRLRRRRRAIGGAALGFALTSCVVLLIVQWTRDANPDRVIQAAVADASVNESAVPAVAKAVISEEKPATIQLFARIRGDSPVFEFNRETKQLQQVGWLSSERMVPVDMRYVPSQQQETFNAVLDREGAMLSL